MAIRKVSGMNCLTDGQWERWSQLVAQLKPLPSDERKAKLRSLQTKGDEDALVLSMVATQFMLPPEPDRDRRGERIGQYTLGEPIAYGGMGVVYRARQENLERDVALKMIDPTLLAHARDDAVARFNREFRTLAKLEGKRSIVTLHDGGTYQDPATGETPYCAMQLIEGAVPITAFTHQHELGIKQRLDLFVRVCEAIEFAHSYNIIHRDLKPANILVDRDGEPFVIDFGLAQVIDPWIAQERLSLTSGTPAYMSPEQVSDDYAIGPKTDVYALGLILYELLTWRHPYEVPGGSFEAIRDAILSAMPQRLGKVNRLFKGSELETFVAKALAKEPDERCTLLGLKAAIERYQPPVASLQAPRSDQPVKVRVTNPYRGLQAFHQEHAPYFFGRESLAEELRVRLDKQPLISLVGASGSGKSSLVFAGLIPRLEIEGSWLIAEIRPQGNLFQQLALALAPYVDTSLVRQVKAIKEMAQGLREGAIELSDILAMIIKNYPAKRLLLIVDQFEELYTQRYDAEMQRRFLERLLATIDDPDSLPRFTLLLTLRADFMGHALSSEPFAEALSRYPETIVRPLNNAELTAAIEGPAKKQNVELEAGLAERILQDVRSEPGNLPLLQFALTQLWEGQENGELTHAAYEATGGVERALTHHADAIYARYSPDDKQRLRHIFIQLVSPGEGTEESRRLATREQIGEGNWPLAMELAGEKTRLVVANRDDGTETLEVVHEALIRHWQPLRQWLDEDRELRLWQQGLRQAIRDWEHEGQDSSGLLRGLRLANAEEKSKLHGDRLSAAERRFIEVSAAFHRAEIERRSEEQRRWETAEHEAQRAHRERLQSEAKAAQQLARRTRYAALVMAGLALIAAGGGYLAYDRSLEAEQQRELADVRRGEAEHRRNDALHTQSLFLASLSQQQTLAGNATNGIYLALEALPSDSNPRPYVPLAEAALYQALVGHREKRVFTHPGGRISHAAFSPDGLRLVTASKDATARVWDVETGEQRLVLSGHGAWVSHVAFSPDGRHLVTASEDATARLWDAESGEPLFVLHGHENQLYHAAFSPDGQRIVTASGDGTARVWNATNGEPIAVFTGHEAWVSHAAFSSDGQWVVTGSGDGTARVWDAGSGKALVAVQHEAWVSQAAFSPDGQRIISVSEDGTAKLADAATGELLLPLNHEAWAHHAAFRPDGDQLVVAYGDGTARVWDMVSLKAQVILQDQGTRITHAVFSPDGLRIITGSGDGTVRLWNAASGEPLTVLKGHEQPLYQLAFSQGDHYLLSVSEDGTARVWDLATNKPLVFKGHTHPLQHAGISPDGRWLVTASADGSARLWDLRSGEPVMALEGHKDWVRRALFSPDGRHVLTASGDGTARLWDRASGNSLLMLTDHAGGVEQAALSADGRRVLTVSGSGTVRLWNATNGKLIETLDETRVVHAAFSPDSRYVATASGDGAARVWDTVRGEIRSVVQGHGKRLHHIAFSPDGSKLVTASADARAQLWNTHNGALLATLEGHKAWLVYAAFSSDGQSVITTSEDGTARIWAVMSGQLLTELSGHASRVHHAAFSPDGRRVLTVSGDATARIWDAATGETLTVLTQGRVTHAAFSPNGRQVVTACEDGLARLWRILPAGQELVAYANRILPRQLTPQQRKRFFLE